VRGRRLVLQYTDGSPCATSSKRSTSDDAKSSRRKSTIISFHCDKDPLATQAVATFVGTDPDECSYTFEVLSKAACITAEPAKQAVGPGAVFTIIGIIAILVYFLGGVFYQRNVAHARGWRQLPNYSMWAGIGSFIKVSGTCLHRSKYRAFPRVASVRDGILPTMEVRPSTSSNGGRKSHKSYIS
jgi:cation-dependent mannose-6-phosphate receptor